MASTRNLQRFPSTPGPCSQDGQLSSALGSQFLVSCAQGVPVPALSLLAVWLHAQHAGTLSPEARFDLVSSLSLGLSPDCCSWLDPMSWTSDLLFFIFPSLELLLDPVSSSWLWSEPVGHSLCWGHQLLANLPLGNNFTSLVYASRVKVYTKLILKRCSYHLFGQILILFGLLHFYYPNNFPLSIIDILHLSVRLTGRSQAEHN